MAIAVECTINGRQCRAGTGQRALHFGSEPLAGADNFIIIKGADVAPHHGKIFCAQGGYWYVNLTEYPTTLFRGRDFRSEMNPFFPQCTVRTGDRLGIGGAVIEIVQLEPPTCKDHLAGDKPAKRQFSLKPAPPLPLTHFPPVNTLTEFTRLMRHYTTRSEMVRQAGDWLLRTLRGLRPHGKSGIRGARTAKVLGIRWEEIGKFGKQHGLIDHCGSTSGLTGGHVHWSHRLPQEQLRSYLQSGKPFGIADKDRVLAVGLGIDVERHLESRRHAAGSGGETTPRPGAEHRPFYLFTVEPGPGKLLPENWVVLFDFGQQLANALSTMVVKQELLNVHLDLDIMRQVPQLFHDNLRHVDGTKRALDALIGDSTVDLEQAKALAIKARSEVEFLSDLASWCMNVLDPTRPPRNLFRPVDLVKYLHSSQFESRLNDPDPTSRVEFSPCGGPVILSCDSFGIYRIIDNLVANASKAIANAPKTIARPNRPRKPQIAVWLRKARRKHAGRTLNYVVVRVLDKGPGLTAEALHCIFHTQIIGAYGRGYGTAIVTRQVHLHEGFIEVVSEPGAGTAISVYLPALTADICPGHESLAPYREYAHQYSGQGRWNSFKEAARKNPDCREMLEWMQKWRRRNALAALQKS